CFIIEKLGDWCPGILPNQEVFFRISLEALLEQELQLKCGPDHQHDEQQIQELREALQNLQASLLQTQAELLGLYREQNRSTGKGR
ncbi:hypothetical protein, partial [Pseudomonas putida]|uniref:hypothetical protein n=1 Tax=Pseudomonas putida TaxID=303 RepID=UPI001E3A3E30